MPETKGSRKIGAHPTNVVQTLARTPGVNVTGFVKDTRDHLRTAAISIAPLRIARGIQNKVLESMAMARPTVVTRDALEGIEATPGREVLLADTAEAFAAACLEAARPEAAPMGRAARQRVLSDYVWAERLRGFDELLAAANTPRK